MKYHRLGTTGLNVSRICLGCMSYGDPDATMPGEAHARWKWALREDEAPAVLQAGARARHQLLRHGERLLVRRERGDHRPRAARTSRGGRSS